MNIKKYLVCIDSDGCAIDSMNIKHICCFGPAFVEVWNLEAQKEAILARWNQINLFSATRGINRFKGLAMILEEVSTNDTKEEIQSFAEWTKNATELSNSSLKEFCRQSGYKIFQKALKWSLLVNQLIEELPVSEPFTGVKKSLINIHQSAEIAIVSSANKEAIQMEWEYGNLTADVDYIFSQSDGSKSECINKMLKKEYEPKRVLMVGDAPGDYRAAKDNGVWFYPILAGKEVDSWRDLSENILNLFLEDRFSQQTQQVLVDKMMDNLCR